jgi:hypothetical protein
VDNEYLADFMVDLNYFLFSFVRQPKTTLANRFARRIEARWFASVGSVVLPP